MELSSNTSSSANNLPRSKRGTVERPGAQKGRKIVACSRKAVEPPGVGLTAVHRVMETFWSGTVLLRSSGPVRFFDRSSYRRCISRTSHWSAAQIPSAPPSISCVKAGACLTADGSGYQMRPFTEWHVVTRRIPCPTGNYKLTFLFGVPGWNVCINASLSLRRGI